MVVSWFIGAEHCSVFFVQALFFRHYHISVLASPVICKEILQNYRQSHCHSAFGACLGKVKH